MMTGVLQVLSGGVHTCGGGRVESEYLQGMSISTPQQWGAWKESCRKSVSQKGPLETVGIHCNKQTWRLVG